MEQVSVSTPNTSVGVVKSVSASAVTIGRVYAAQFQKNGTETAELRQTVNSFASYPAQKVGNSFNGNIFDIEEFGFSTQDFNSIENRVAWMLVPAGTTMEIVSEKLKNFPGACLYRILDNRPIITEDQRYSISIGQRTYDEFANSQVVRYPENHPTLANQIIKDPNGNVQYRQVFFSPVAKQDMDNRTLDATKHFISPEIQAELAGIGLNATVVPSQGL